MATVTNLATHLLGLLQPAPGAAKNAAANVTGTGVPVAGANVSVAKSDAARMAFYHFLKNLCEAGEPLSTSVLDRFFRRALGHQHWSENKLELFTEVASCLQHFSNQTGEPIPLPPFSSPDDLQMVRAESFRTLELVVENWIQQHQGPTDQIRILKDREEKLLVCRLAVDRSLSVHIFDRALCIRDGRLEPLVDDMAVYYNSDLSIDSARLSQIETAPHTVARFKFNNGYRGIQVRGYTFQKTATFDGGDLHRHPLLFYPLKRIEQFFVNRATDPMYIELTNLLEQASDLMARKHPERLRFAEAAIERGRLAFEQVFVDDRLLRLLLENLERAIQLEHRTVPYETLPEENLRPAMPVEMPLQLGHNLGLNLAPGQEFIEPSGPDLVELQEAEKCETIAPLNRELQNL
ncbi:MAG: hypothetical protein J0L82_03945 [Deltaproteobacteria bacterium]|jgi:hypothetical protein|nr:hypothetical protein [Deltaproteobacteria bacterium]